MKKPAILAIFLLSLCHAAQATIRHVRATGGSNTAPYTSWATASSDLQRVINASGNGDTVFVGAGTYVGADRFPGAGFYMRQGVVILGGFPEGGGSLEDRDWVAHPSILQSSNGKVIESRRLTRSSVLDGFTITGGDGDAIYPGTQYTNDGFGGGMINDHSSPTICHCRFVNNKATKGGGIFNNSASPLIIDCIFSGNNADQGGGIFSVASAETIVNCIFSGNNGDGFNGQGQVAASITNCIFSGNKTQSGNGGINATSLTIRNSIVYGNSTGATNTDYWNISNCLIQGLPGGNNGNLNGNNNPLFADAPAFATAPFTGGDYRLQFCSPAIDKGSNSWLNANSAVDMAGNPRVENGTVDMGVYEFKGSKTTMYVDAGRGNDDWDGTSWTKAFKTFGKALEVVKQGCYAGFDTIFVAKGTYQPAAGQSFSMVEGVKIFGGFIAGGSWAQRNGELHTSLLKGNGATVIENNNNGLTAAALLDGFSITGTASGFTGGGGMRNLQVSPTISHCIFAGNRAFSGASMYNSQSSPLITHCLFTGNHGEYSGGLYNAAASSPTLINCSFSGNRSGIGGAIYNSSSTVTLRNSIIYGNSQGIYNDANSTAVTRNSLVQGLNSTANGNIAGTTNPLFMDAPAFATAPFTGGNYSLQACSPVIDMGSNSWLGAADTTDLAGKPRLAGPAVDMGAYETFKTGTQSLYVDSAYGNDSHTGTSWTTAFKTFQKALASVKQGCYAAYDTILVATGTYRPDASGKYFSMVEGVKIYGGFPSGGGSWAERDWQAHPSILRGYGRGPIYNDQNGLTSAALLDGFTITGGTGLIGSGMYNVQASPRVSHCLFTGNAGYSGGGMYNSASNPLITSCIFSGNSASNNGGGMSNFSNAAPIIINCSFSGNNAPSGGAIRHSSGAGSVLTIRNSVIYGNSSGIALVSGSTAISNSLVQGLAGGSNGNLDGSTNPLFIDAPSHTTAHLPAAITGYNPAARSLMPAAIAGWVQMIP